MPVVFVVVVDSLFEVKLVIIFSFRDGDVDVDLIKLGDDDDDDDDEDCVEESYEFSDKFK